ncbi:MAG: xylulokinase [Candidatus Atribacteria bacterium]|nr:xylulokinase [Candidatus Atribacteria bacterium]
MSKKYILGVDLGTSSIKASLLDLETRSILRESVELSVSYPDSFSAEQNPEDWWKGFCKLISQLKSRVGDLDGLSAIGLSGQMLGLVLLDEKGNPVRPCILWCDQRSYREIEEIKEKVSLEELLEYTANTPLTGYWLPKILWLKKHEPRVLAQTFKMLFPKDFLRLKLTGNFTTEVSDASSSFLFDVAHRTWSKEMMDIFQVDPATLPQVVESPEITGYLTEEAARETGLPAGIPVVGGGGDQSSGGIGLGVVYPGLVSCVLGTSGVVMAQTEEAKMDHENRGLHSFCYSVPGKWFLMGCTLAAGGSYQWIFNSLTKLDENLSFDKLNSLAGEVSPGSKGLIFLPYLIGERTPHSDPNARGVFFGLSYEHDIRHMIRSVIEGVAFSQRESVEILKSFSLTAQKLTLSGGAARSPLWCQIMADVMGMEVETTNIEDPASTGAAFIAGVGTGIFNSFSQVCENFIQPLEHYQAIDSHFERYQALFEKYRALYRVLRDFYPDFTSLQQEIID